MTTYEHIFIIGVSRVGSKFYMQLLNSHNNIFIAPEMLFKHPNKSDLYQVIAQALKNPTNSIELVEKLFSSKIKDTFNSTINLINKETLHAELNIKNASKTPYNVFKIIIGLAARAKGKKISGAKFPVHFSYINELIEECPKAKIIFLTRDPREIYLSDAKKKKKELEEGKSMFPVKGLFFIPAIFLYTIKEWYISLKKFNNCLNRFGSDKIMLFKYENILLDEAKVINSLAGFLNLSGHEFSNQNVKILDSSFDKKPELNRWKNELSKFEKLLFKLLLYKSMKKYGYA